ncbi:MAG: TadE/TadG family type IV pilus assembly protein [Methylococcaceae bacterium]|nr:TadE/TadG family type IV pilus assembly protein [Methylococcaceae bacterium]
MKLKYAQKGLAIVEFALVAALLLVILFGIMELGLVMYDKAIITNASREAARSGIVLRKNADGTPWSIEQIQALATDVVNSYCGTYVVSFKSGETCHLNPDPTQTTDAYGTKLTVTVTYNYYNLAFGNLLTLLSGGTFPYPLPLSATTAMYMEQ